MINTHFFTKAILKHRLELLYSIANRRIPIIKPDFLCIGAARTGTTWLYTTLDLHPDVYVPKRKESHFFDEPIYANHRGKKIDIHKNPDSMYFDLSNEAHWRWYYLQFKNAEIGQIKGDITPGYAVLSEERISLIRKFLPDIQVIYILRNPIERAWSGVRKFIKSRKKEKVSDFPNDILIDFAMQPRRLLGGDYKSAIIKWEKYFDISRILYLFYDDLVADPKKQFNKVCNFLKIDPQRILEKKLLSKRVNAANDTSTIPDAVYEALKAHYLEQIPFLEEKFERDLSDWLR